jgi:GDPmannose 4,6-dehydratase
MEFVTRKITDAVAKIKLGKLDYLELGNINAKRDWGYAGDYVEAMWLMLQADQPDNFVIATNKNETVRDFISLSFKAAGIEIAFSGKDQNEVGVDVKTNKVLLKINPKFYRPAEVDLLIGDYSKARLKLKWEPKVSLESLSEMMVRSDMNRNK